MLDVIPSSTTTARGRREEGGGRREEGGGWVKQAVTTAQPLPLSPSTPEGVRECARLKHTQVSPSSLQQLPKSIQAGPCVLPGLARPPHRSSWSGPGCRPR